MWDSYLQCVENVRSICLAHFKNMNDIHGKNKQERCPINCKAIKHDLTTDNFI